MKRMLLLLACMLLALAFVACNNEGNSSQGTQKESESENTSVGGSETEFNSTEGSAEKQTEKESEFDSTELPTISWDMSWDEIVMNAPDYMGAKKIDEEFNSPNTDLSKWFVKYNGEEIQRIYDPKDSSGPAKRKDIIFYQTEESDIQLILKTMIDAMVQPLMMKDENREYVITKYELKEQNIKQINENVWLVRSIQGYYVFEGADFGITMEMALPHETDVKDGMINFFADGSASTTQYILVKYGSVYRLQKATDMGGYGVEL